MATGTSINDPRRSLAGWQEAAGWHPNPYDPGQGREYVRVSAMPRGESESAQLIVRQVMTDRVRFCRPDDTFAAAAVAMWEADCRFLPVVDRIGHPIGVVTDGDICLLGSTDHRPLRDILVREGMSGLPATCRDDDDVLDALELMRVRRVRHLPVVDREGLLVGVVGLTDLILRAEEEGFSHLREDLAATLQAIVQKHGSQRIVRQNSFVKD